MKKGKEYDENGRLIFEGEYLDGKKWNGKSKEFDKNGLIIFEGEYSKGKRCNCTIYDKKNNLQ